MKTRLVVCGVIRKGHPASCKIVLLDSRICPESGGMAALFQKWWGRMRRPLPLIGR